jgi:TonB family protein
MAKMRRRVSIWLFILWALTVTQATWGQSASRTQERKWFGSNFTLAVYQFDEAGSRPIDQELRFGQTFESAEAEMGYMKRTFGLQDLAVRHIRSVGLIPGEVFHDGAPIGDETLGILITAEGVSSLTARFAVKITYGDKVLLEATGLKLQNFETIAVKGGRAKFGIQKFVGPQGPEQLPAERTLLMTATAVIVPVSQLQNRPRDISHPTDQFGEELDLKETDIFLPPSIVKQVVPKVPMKQRITRTILLEAIVTPEGKIINIRVLRSFDAELGEKAVAAFKEYKCLPARLNGAPVHATLRVEIGFQPTTDVLPD